MHHPLAQVTRIAKNAAGQILQSKAFYLFAHSPNALFMAGRSLDPQPVFPVRSDIDSDVFSGNDITDRVVADVTTVISTTLPFTTTQSSNVVQTITVGGLTFRFQDLVQVGASA